MKVKLRVKVEQHIRANARRGARALDKVYPEWFRQGNVSLERLDQTDGCKCVWGQLRNGPKVADDAFHDAFHKLTDAGGAGYCPGDETTKIGQTTEDERVGDDEEWHVLQDEWEKQIRIRRRAAGLRAAA